MCSGRSIADEISSKFVMYTQHHFQSQTTQIKKSNLNVLMSREPHLIQVENGLRLGTFLADSGWLLESFKVFTSILNVINAMKVNHSSIILKLDCLQRLLQTQVSYCHFSGASKTLTIIEDLLKNIKADIIPKNLTATYYKVLSMLYFAKSEYSKSYEWSIKALELIGPNTPEKYFSNTSFRISDS